MRLSKERVKHMSETLAARLVHEGHVELTGQHKALVEALEGENVPIEEALKHFEEGMELVGVCERKLHEVRKRVEQILEKKGAAGTADGSEPYPAE